MGTWRNIGTNPPTDFLGTTDAQPLVFKTNVAEHVRLDVSGNLGIGTANPETRLHIYSPDNNALKVTNTAVAKSLRIGVDQLGAWLEPTEQNSSIRLNANPTRVGLLIDGQTGNVGIGTTTPGSKLEVSGTLTVNNDQDVAVRATGGASGGVVGTSLNSIGVSGISTSFMGVYAQSATGNCIKAYSAQFTEEPQELIEADNTEPGAFARLRMVQTNTVAEWDIAVGGPGNIMKFDAHPGIDSVLTLFTNGDARLSGNLQQNSSRAL